MEIMQQRLFADEGQSVGEIGLEPFQDGLIRVETVEFLGGREDGAGEGLVLHVQEVSPPWGMEVEGTGPLNLIW